MEDQRRYPDYLRSPEHLLYVECSDWDNTVAKVWFVNNSDETINYVRPAGYQYATAGDDIIHLSQDAGGIEYRDVAPGEAVLIDRYDMIFDGDFVFIPAVDVKSNDLGERHLANSAGKGNPPNVTLLWKPLPEEMNDPDKPDQLLDPVKAARIYCAESGRYIANSVPINKGDLMYEAAPKRLMSCGLRLELEKLRNGHSTNYHFVAEDGRDVFRTLDLDRAAGFARGLVPTSPADHPS